MIFALNNIVGTDVHPLAVTIARINYMLALSEHLETENVEGEAPPLPVFMADALIRPLENRSKSSVAIPVDRQKDEIFHIPLGAEKDASKLTRTIEQMDRIANIVTDPDKMTRASAAFRDFVQVLYGTLTNPTFINHWASNLQLLINLIREERDSIWAIPPQESIPPPGPGGKRI